MTSSPNDDKSHKENQSSRVVIDWGFFKSIPISDILEVVGIESDRQGRFLCPAHNDRNPSAKINPKYNSWKCWSCNCGGSTLDLVKYAMNCPVKEAALYLNQYFPGGVQTQIEDELTPPMLSVEIKKAVGLNSNPYGAYGTKLPKSAYVNDDGIGSDEIKYVSVRMDFDDDDRLVITDMVIDKLKDAVTNYQAIVKSGAADLAELESKAETDYDKAFCDVFASELENNKRMLQLLIAKTAEFETYKNRLVQIYESPQAVASQDEIERFFEMVRMGVGRDMQEDGEIER